MNGTIYLLSNRKTGLEYVGQTTQPLPERLRGHRKAARFDSNTKLAEAIRVFGWDSFDVTVLETGIDNARDLNYAEAKHIVEKRTYWPDGYNMTFGGSRDAVFCRGKKQPANVDYVEAYLSGMTAAQVGKKYGVCAVTVLKHVRKAGFDVRKNGFLSGGEIVQAHRAGASIAELAKEYGVTRTTIKYHLERAKME